MSDKASEAMQQFDELLHDYAEKIRAIAQRDRKVADAVASAKAAALAEQGDANVNDLASAERLRLEILAFATANRHLLADGKSYITGNNGTVKWNVTKKWEIDVAPERLLALIRRLRAVRFVVDVERTVSKEKINQNPWIWARLEKLGAAHHLRTTTFSITPTGFTSNPKKNPNQLTVSSERIHEE